ncbi:MAG: NADH-quinone oxidoreductase subunit NuoB [Thermodesulfobacteriota bacterium]|nr:NADH-quinone oxidoreductase subunit NuoB [Thermodesulfobacteriota bacterium]|tara:strand:- start:581 stop:1570 length:990 start_codon:yes stop_codon:yes gene_type:complete
MGNVKKSLEDIGTFTKLPGANLFITSTKKLFNWAQKSSLWPLSFGLACCAIEMMATFSSRYDLDRLGMITRASPRQADLMIIAGTVTVKMSDRIKTLYDQMASPKWVIAAGSCAISGDHYRHIYSVVPGVDWVIPVDVYVPGCPPTPEAFIEGIMELQNIISTGKASPTKNVPCIKNEIKIEEKKVKKQKNLISNNFIKKEEILNYATTYKNKGFEYLKFITATDFEDGLILTYVISNIKLNEDLEFNIILEDACEVPSLAQIFSGANWQEREIYDLFGINFINHPNMKRIMMPDDWEGYPLRKEYSMNTHKLPYRPTKEEYESWKTKL